MVNHIVLPVTDLERARRFYDATLGPVGWLRFDDSDKAGFGYGISEPVLVLRQVPSSRVRPGGGYISLGVRGMAAVKAASDAALAAGGECEDAPRVRSFGGAKRFSAFLRDPDGHRLELAT